MHIRRMTPDDIPYGMKLKSQAGWNQLEADWRRQLDLEPEGCFIAELEGQPFGTACACVFGDIAWVNLVLVDQHHRGRGIGTALLRHVLNYLGNRRIPTIRLDATLLGQPVYERLGFAGDFGLVRYEGVMPNPSLTPPACVETLTLADLPAVCALDHAVSKTDREKLLRHLFTANPEFARKFDCAGRLEGFCMARPGSNAWQIGPILGTPAAGKQLLWDATQRFAGQRVYLDIPVNHRAAIAQAEALGLNVQRKFLRMTFGRRVEEDLTMFWCSFGPEKG